MKKFNIIILTLFLIIISISGTKVFAATSPGLGMAQTFAILSSTYSNTASGTTLNGDLGYTTPPAVAPTVNGNTYVNNTIYNQAGIDQSSALVNLNNQSCTFNFAPGAIDLATDTTHGAVGVYTPGIYCITGAANIGGGGTISLNGSGTYIFRMTGALTTSANSVVTINGASSCNVWWTPTSATTLGANSTFIGTDISAAGITIGSQVNWTGRALAFGGTVFTSSDNINVPSCNSTTPTITTTATPAITATATPTVTTTTITTTKPIIKTLANTGQDPLLSEMFGLLIISLIIVISINRKKSLRRKFNKN